MLIKKGNRVISKMAIYYDRFTTFALYTYIKVLKPTESNESVLPVDKGL